MPTEKSHRVSLRKRERNTALRSSAKTQISKARSAIEQKEASSAEGAVKQAIVALDKAAGKGAIHANNAARRKSRLAKKLNSLKSSK